jgi:hypothetical protein
MSRRLPEHPNLRHLKDQAKDLLKAGSAKSLSDAQFQIARTYGFASWPKLKAHIESLEEIGQLKAAIDRNEFDRVKEMMLRNPALHQAPIGYGKDGPLTWLAECRIPWEPPGPGRLELAHWMIENGSDVHQGQDGPLMRAVLNSYRIAMADVLYKHGANINAHWHGRFPIIFAPCESHDPVSLRWLVERGVDTTGALDYLIEAYARSSRLAECIDILLQAGATTKYNVPAFLAMLRGRMDDLTRLLDDDPSLLHRRFPELECGQTGDRWLTLKGATLLHAAAEYGNFEAVRLLLDRGADINARALIDERGVGGQTPIFHPATQHFDAGLPMVQLLIERGADLSIRVKLPGAYERAGEVVECTPAEYSHRFPEGPSKTAALLQAES